MILFRMSDCMGYLVIVWLMFQGTIISCQASEEKTQLLYSNESAIYLMDLETKNVALVTDQVTQVWSIDYHYGKNLVVWTDVTDQKIYSLSLLTGERKTLHSCSNPKGLAVDWIHYKFYWTEYSRVGVSEFNSTKYTILFENIYEPTDIVLTPSEGWMYWAFSSYSGVKIARAGMDGTHHSVIVSKTIGWVNGLSIDLTTRRIFWVDIGDTVIFSTDYNGEDFQTLRDFYIYAPVALDVFGQWLYCKGKSGREARIYRGDKHNGNLTRILEVDEWAKQWSIKVYHPDKQPTEPNICENSPCPHLCLPAPKISDDYEIKFTCVDVPTVEPLSASSSLDHSEARHVTGHKAIQLDLGSGATDVDHGDSDTHDAGIEKRILTELGERFDQMKTWHSSEAIYWRIGCVASGISTLVLVAFCCYKVFRKSSGTSAINKQKTTLDCDKETAL